MTVSLQSADQGSLRRAGARCRGRTAVRLRTLAVFCFCAHLQNYLEVAYVNFMLWQMIGMVDWRRSAP